MNQQLIILLSEAFTFLILLAAFVVLVSSNIYDIRQKINEKTIQKIIRKLRGSRQPSVTVIVYSDNNVATIEECLDSIRKSRYKNFDVVVADNSSSDNTRKKVRQFKEKYPIFHFRFYPKRVRNNMTATLSQGYNRSQKGDLVLVIDASTMVDANLIKSSVSRFEKDSKLNTLRFDAAIQSPNSVTMIYYSFLKLSKSLFNKYLSITSQYRVDRLVVGAMYRRCSLMHPSGKGYYDSSLRIQKSSIDDSTAIRHIIGNNDCQIINKIVLSVVFLMLQSYSIYVAATLQSKTLLIIGWSVVVVWAMIAAWSSQAMDIDGRLKITCSAPFVYFLIYAQLVAGLAMVDPLNI